MESMEPKHRFWIGGKCYADFNLFGPQALSYLCENRGYEAFNGP